MQQGPGDGIPGGSPPPRWGGSRDSLPREGGLTPRLPPRRGAPRGRLGRWRFTVLLLAGLVFVSIVRALHATPPPPPSHRTPEAAVAGYLVALNHRDLPGMAEYLAPAARARLPDSLAAVRRVDLILTSVLFDGATLAHGRATVSLAATACYRRAGRPRACAVLIHHPLGLSPLVDAVEVGHRWYVAAPITPGG